MIEADLAVLHDHGLVPSEQPPEAMNGNLQRVAGRVSVRIRPKLVGELGSTDGMTVGYEQDLEQIEWPALRLHAAGEGNAVDSEVESAQRADPDRHRARRGRRFA